MNEWEENYAELFPNVVSVHREIVFKLKGRQVLRKLKITFNCNVKFYIKHKTIIINIIIKT